MNEYSLILPGLEESVAKCRPDLRHAQLVQTLARFPALEGTTLRATRGGDGSIYMQRRKVVRPDGSVEHEDHEAWLEEQLRVDGGNAKVTYARLSQQGYRLSRCDITRLHLACDRGGEDQADFLQVDVDLCDDRVQCALFRGYYFDEPRTLRDLVDFAEGEAVGEDQRTPISVRYELRRVIDVAKFVDLAEQLEEQQRANLRAREYVVTLGDGSKKTQSHADLDPGFERFRSKTRRLFDDWRASSAGRAGARFCEHWLLQFSDWTDPSSRTRYLSVVPLWTFSQKLAEVNARSGDVYGLFSKLQTIDRRVEVPFAWFFYMLHGNRVHDGAGERVLEAAEGGLIVLPEHDYRVLRNWADRRYGF
ncbi:hypothetical protein [Pseudorhodoferax aquiterrae]|uniref:hypothetical protein n=1 Tax=Pseudorhodoferax aquiterrae TaxID=747304 RepID=UPI0016718BC8|nr:hypothetical protein [Pseudorhodoferax aquiterrae]